MFKGRDGNDAASGGLNSVIGEGSQLVGRLRIQGSIRIDGVLEGSLMASDVVVIGRTGRARADLRAREIVVSGTVEGKLIAEERVELQAGARVEGDMWAQSLAIAEGVLFMGSCSMGKEATEYCRSTVRDGQGLTGPMEKGKDSKSLTVVDSGVRVAR